MTGATSRIIHGLLPVAPESHAERSALIASRSQSGKGGPEKEKLLFSFRGSASLVDGGAHPSRCDGGVRHGSHDGGG